MTTQKPIQLLRDDVINKIAAGEVVERPASVVKELLENAVDAGATRIDVDIVYGGRRVIAVTDDGSGMSRDQALLSIERHATSKIRSVDDIEEIDTLGFRGEALAALAAVSRFTLTTCTRDSDVGTELSVSGGKLRDVREVGAPAGTRVEVRNLFFNVPARRKFLRTEQTELSHVRQAFVVHALAHPDVALRLTVDEREVYRLPGAGRVEERIRALFGPGLLPALRPVDYAAVDATVTGFAGLPGTSRSDRSEQYVFVNGRPASAPLIGSALQEAYHGLVPRGRYAVVFLFIRTDPTQIDVNVHPTKKEIRFRRPREIRDAVIEALRGALAGGTPIPEAGAADRPLGGVPDRLPRDLGLQIPDLPVLEPFPYPRMDTATPRSPPSAPGADATGSDEPGPAGPEKGQMPWGWCRILGQVGGLYVVLETDDGLVLMDPHAAHERILFEQFMQQVVRHQVKSQGLLVPESVPLSPRDALHVRRNADLLAAMGFGLSDFGGDSFLIDALPACLGEVSAASVLGPVAQSLERAGSRGGTERCAEEQVAQAACKAAVKSKDRLRIEEIERLVLDLAAAEMPYTCPHGRPTVVFMSYNELDRKFGRT